MSPADTWRSDSGTWALLLAQRLGSSVWCAPARLYGRASTCCFKLCIPSVLGKFGMLLLLGGGPALPPAGVRRARRLCHHPQGDALNAHPGVEACAEKRSLF